MLDKSKIFLHYKRKDLQYAMLACARDREVSIRYPEGGFGKRPDILQYQSDILEMVKAGASSFHVSEERWHNPLLLSPELKKKELEDLRIGWDLVIDIDCPVFEYSKLIAFLVVKTLKRYGIRAISCKFSGNKGFHIAVPFESFPEKVAVKGELVDIRLLFPEGLRRILEFIRKQIDSKERGYELSSMILKKDTVEVVAAKMGIPEQKLFRTVCKKCEGLYKAEYRNFEIKVICPYCEIENKLPPDVDNNFITCEGCGRIVRNEIETKEDVCQKCRSKEFVQKFDSSSILELDSVLISSRHLYRMVYSLHEKSGLASVPVDLGRILEFERDDAAPEKITALDEKSVKFLDIAKCRPNEAAKLIQEAFDDDPLIEVEQSVSDKEYQRPAKAIGFEFFPPCMLKLLEGGMSDGKKRAMFVLANFLDSLGWDHEGISGVIEEWNGKNDEPLREVYIKGQLGALKQKKRHMLPHNCRSYYEDLHVCFPDAICNKVKNPVNYSHVKSWIKEQDEKRKKKRPNLNNPDLTEEQREFMRRRKEEEKVFRKKMREKRKKEGEVL